MKNILELCIVQYFMVYINFSTTLISSGKFHTVNSSSISYKKIVFHVPYKRTNAFTIAQIHSVQNASTFSYQYPPLYGESIKGKHVGLFKRIYPSTRNIKFFDNLNNPNIKQSSFAVYYDINSPIPGACCQTCALETDANLEISYNRFTTTIQFHRGSAFYTESNIPSCDTSESPLTYRLQYKLYYKFLTLHDFSETHLFTALKKMSDVTEIKDFGNELETIYHSEPLKFSAETVSGYATIFNIIVYDPATQKSAAYVPSVSYGCNISIPLNRECTTYDSTSVLVLCIIFALFGLVICLVGLKVYPFIVFISGFLISWLIIFTLMGRYVPDGKNDIHEITIISACCSIVGGATVLFLHAFSKFRYFCFLVVTLCFGLFISSVIFYTPFGYYDIWNVDYRFLLGFLSFTLGVALFCLFFPRMTIYLFSSIIGTYGVVLVPNYFMYGNMQYIIVTVLLRMTVYDFGTSFLRRPYQKEEMILTGVWVASAILSFIIHYFLTRKDEFEISGKKIRNKAWFSFSQSYKKLSNRKRRRYKSYNSPTIPRLNENTPLISEENRSNTFYTSNTNPTFSSFGNSHNQQVTQVDVHNTLHDEDVHTEHEIAQPLTSNAPALPSAPLPPQAPTPSSSPPPSYSDTATLPSAPPTYEESETSSKVI